MVRAESPSTQTQLGIGQSFDLQLSLKNHEKSLTDKVALVTNISAGIGAEIAILLAKEGVQILGIVGNSRKEQENAKKVAMHIDYSGGDIELVYKDITSPEDRKRLQRQTSVRKPDILVLNCLGGKTDNALIDELLLHVREGGKIILVGHEDEAMESLRERVQIIPEFNKKDISFFVVSPQIEGEHIGEKVSELLKRKDLPMRNRYNALVIDLPL